MSFDEHVKDLIPGYALGCLDEADEISVSEHLAVCEDCTEEMRTYQAVVDQLPLAAPQVDPPDRVKKAVMDRITVKAASPILEDHRRSGLWDRLLEFTRRVSPAWGAVSLVLILALASSNLLLWRQVRQTGAVAQPPAFQVVNLTNTTAAPDATGMLVISKDGRTGTLVVDRLPKLTQQQQYQLWLIDKDGKRTSGGVFSVEWGYASLWVSSAQPLNSYPAFGITIEPFGGSPGPTGEKVLGGKL